MVDLKFLNLYTLNFYWLNVEHVPNQIEESLKNYITSSNKLQKNELILT